MTADVVVAEEVEDTVVEEAEAAKITVMTATVAAKDREAEEVVQDVIMVEEVEIMKDVVTMAMVEMFTAAEGNPGPEADLRHLLDVALEVMATHAKTTEEVLVPRQAGRDQGP